MTDPKELLECLRGDETKLVCGCGKDLIPVRNKEGKQIGVTHTIEDEEWHLKQFSSLRVKVK